MAGIRSKLRKWLFGRDQPLKTSADTELPHSGTSGETDTPIVGYHADRPITFPNEDRFGRWSFACRIAETLAERGDSSSIVIGLYGPWGDGKTSVLALMKNAFNQNKDVVTVEFNPWYFSSQEMLLNAFFNTLADALGGRLQHRSEEIGTFLKKYGSILSMASVTIAGGIQISPGAAANSLGEGLSTVELGTLRDRLETILSEAGLRIVVMIDDIDRLDRDEIHAILKLVKLSAGFKHVNYILAFDDEVVSASLGARYGSGDTAAGRSFLEKVVQVPLRLPPVDPIELRQLTFDGLNAVLAQNNIELSESDTQAFVSRFIDGLEPKLRTPRQSRLYVNAVTFALPLLSGEVHTVDQMLIEGIRVFYPALHSVIRDNPTRFIAQTPYRQSENFWQSVDELIDTALGGLTEREKDQVKQRLLVPLFPRYGNAGYGSDWEKTWMQEQRICSEEYFHRYFAYGVPRGDISDQQIERLLAQISSMLPEQTLTTLSDIASKRAFPKLVRKLRLREQTMDISAGASMALAIVQNGLLLPRENQMLTSDMTFMQTAIFCTAIVRRHSTPDEQKAFAKRLLAAAEPLALAFKLFQWLRADPENTDDHRIFEQDIEDQIGAILAERVKSMAERGPLYRSASNDTPALLYAWNKYGNPNEVRSHLTSCLTSAEEALAFLKTYIGISWSMDSGIPHPADFERESYNSVANYIDVELILLLLKERFGTSIDTPEFHHSNDTPRDEIVAHQFSVCHQTALAEEGLSPSDQVQGDDVEKPEG